MDDSQIPSSQTDPKLPMVVHLLGNEDYVEEFNHDAQMAMEFLGIKRSRLTQISGRELRVGRIRQDRYIRPVFRKRDLEDYRNWTRSTASHQSSSYAIEQAVQKLEDQCESLEQTTLPEIKSTLSKFSVDILASFRLFSDSLIRNIGRHFMQTLERMHQYHEIGQGTRIQIKGLLGKLLEKQKVISDHISQSEQLSAELLTDLSGVRASFTQLTETHNKVSAKLEDHFRGSSDELSLVALAIKELSQEVKHNKAGELDSYHEISQRLSQLEKNLEKLSEQQKRHEEYLERSRQDIMLRQVKRKIMRRQVRGRRIKT